VKVEGKIGEDAKGSYATLNTRAMSVKVGGKIGEYPKGSYATLNTRTMLVSIWQCG